MQHQESATGKKAAQKKQHENSASRKKSKMKIMLDDTSARRTKKCNMEIERREKSAKSAPECTNRERVVR